MKKIDITIIDGGVDLQNKFLYESKMINNCIVYTEPKKIIKTIFKSMTLKVNIGPLPELMYEHLRASLFDCKRVKVCWRVEVEPNFGKEHCEVIHEFRGIVTELSYGLYKLIETLEIAVSASNETDYRFYKG